MKRPALDTLLVHAGEPIPRDMGAVVMPIYQSATYEYSGGDDYRIARYIRYNNTPNHEALHAKLAALESGESALVFASGMAAISTTLLSIMETGDHIIAQDSLYGGTHAFLTKDLPSFGISSDFVNLEDRAAWRRAIKPRTRVVYVETISNPLLSVPDLESIVSLAKEHGLISVIDNTFASPVNYRPIEHGFDLSLHSATKYLNGHHDVVAGCVIGSVDLVQRIKQRLDRMGASLDPHAAFLLHRGIKTLGVRVRHQNESAMQIARALERSKFVERVNYPGLPAHPSHPRASEWFEGYGGMLSFELDGGVRAAEKFLEKVRIPVVAPSLGGVDSLLTLPARTSHSGLTSEQREQLGIGDGLVRMSVGLEDPRDLIDDLEEALARHN